MRTRTTSRTLPEAAPSTEATPSAASAPSAAPPAPPAPRTDPGCSLAELAPGTRAEVVDVLGDRPTATRLHELGFTPGTVVEVVRRAPLRDPVVYRLKDYELCLRRAQAACVRTVVAG